MYNKHRLSNNNKYYQIAENFRWTKILSIPPSLTQNKKLQGKNFPPMRTGVKKGQKVLSMQKFLAMQYYFLTYKLCLG